MSLSDFDCFNFDGDMELRWDDDVLALATGPCPTVPAVPTDSPLSYDSHNDADEGIPDSNRKVTKTNGHTHHHLLSQLDMNSVLVGDISCVLALEARTDDPPEECLQPVENHLPEGSEYIGETQTHSTRNRRKSNHEVNHIANAEMELVEPNCSNLNLTSTEESIPEKSVGMGRQNASMRVKRGGVQNKQERKKKQKMHELDPIQNPKAKNACNAFSRRLKKKQEDQARDELNMILQEQNQQHLIEIQRLQSQVQFLLLENQQFRAEKHRLQLGTWNR